MSDESIPKFRDYEYRTNANIVLTTNQRIRHSEPSSEPTSLRGTSLARFGDLAQRQNAPVKKKKVTTTIKTTTTNTSKKFLLQHVKRQKQDILSASMDYNLDKNIYRPRTEETTIAYENLLHFIVPLLSDVPQDVIRSASQEILSILKDDSFTDQQKFQLLQNDLLPEIQQDDYTKLLQISNRITDYIAPDTSSKEDTNADNAKDTLEELSLALTETGEEAQDDDAVYEAYVRDENEEEEEEGEEAETKETLGVKPHQQQHLQQEKSNDPYFIDAKTIDAYWLQRELNQFYAEDANVSQQKALEVFSMLEDTDLDTFDCESNLVLILEQDKLKFIQKLLRNRWKIVYCIKLQQLASQEDRVREVEQEMSRDENLKSILIELGRVQDSSTVQKSKRKRTTTTSDVEMKDASDSSSSALEVVDLDTLIFEQGSHTMTNKTTELPSNISRNTFKSYEEVIIPPNKPVEIQPDELVSISTIPTWARAAFPGVERLNRVQSRVYETALFTPENMLICAPTGAGKTNVAVLSILHEFGLHKRQDQEEFAFADTEFKIVYVAPMKALVQEVVGNLTERLALYGVKIAELTGDRNMTRQQLDETQIIVTTPEKWDIVTRKSGDRSYIQQVKLLLIDEIHLLHDERGPVLESIVARTIRQQEATQENIRIIGLSATLPNYKDVAAFIRVKPDHLFYFDSSYRTVPLHQTYIGITEKKPLKRYQIMNEITFDKVMQHAGVHQVLVFVHSRKETAKTAKMIRDMATQKNLVGKFLREGTASWQILQEESKETKNKDLKELLGYSIGIHHAGMSRKDRSLVEDLFFSKHLQILVSTSTLAWGVNLPGHTVIIKGTQIYSPEKGRWIELSPLDVMQMIGRAGRPQFDKLGEGIIITTHQELQFYLSLLNQQLPIESQFFKKLADALNAEIVLGTVQNVQEAIDWLSYTYLYVRMLKNPTLYGVTKEHMQQEDRYLTLRRTELIHSAALLLDKHGLIKYDTKTGFFQVTDLGRIASYYYVSYKSIAAYNEMLQPNLNEVEMFKLFTQSEEFKFVAVRQEEKLEIQKLMERVPIPIKETAEDPSAKINVLLQAYISKLKLEGFALMADMVYITQSATRIIRALFEICLSKGWSALTQKFLSLAKMIENQMWGSQSPLRQFSGIPDDLVKQIEKKDIAWDRLYDLSPAELGDLVRFQKIGKTLYKYIHQFPRLDLTAHVQPITRSVLRVELTITPDFQYNEAVHGPAQTFWIIVEDGDGQLILHQEPFVLKKKFAEEEHYVSFTVPVFDPLPPQYFVRVLADKWVKSETVLPISFRKLVLPERYAPPTELLDLQPLPITALKHPTWQQLFPFTHFNSIQTQVFSSAYNSDENLYVGTATGNGKTVIAMLCMLRSFSIHSNAKIVYIVPKANMLHSMEHYFSSVFSKIDKSVCVLTGDSLQTDHRLVERNSIIICTPIQWDMISRKWKTRKSVKQVTLFIVDELHCMANDPIMEVIIARMRYIASLLKDSSQSLRIVGLSTSVANGKELGEWIGASTKSNTLFSFHSSVRVYPMEIHIQGFTQSSYTSRMIAMSKPVWLALKQQKQQSPCMVFVSNAKQAKFIALELITFLNGCATKEEQYQFVTSSFQQSDIFTPDSTLHYCLQYGIGIYDDTLCTASQLQTLQQLYQQGQIRLLIIPYHLSWTMQHYLHCHCCIIMGTQYYDGKENRYKEYSVMDVLQMMGRAVRPLQDSFGVCYLFCNSSKKEYYKKFIYEPFPVESQLDQTLTDHLNAEIVTQFVKTTQEAVNYLTWTFLFKRLKQNPNYYNLHGVSAEHVRDYLSDLIETSLQELQVAKCIAMEQSQQEEQVIVPLHLGMIASHYYIHYTTIELFANSVTSKTKTKGLIEILSAATEFDSSILIRKGEEEVLHKLSAYIVNTIEKAKWNDPHTKVNLLLQSHFSRLELHSELEMDKQIVLEQCGTLLSSMIDVISSNHWLKPALESMELYQMMIQAMWNRDSYLMQVPYFSKETIQLANQKYKVKSVFDLIEMEEEDRNALFASQHFSSEQLEEIAKALNRYPNIAVQYQFDEEGEYIGDESEVQLKVELEIDENSEEEMLQTPVYAPFWKGKKKTEQWWLVIGEPNTNTLLSIARLQLTKRVTQTQLQFIAPKEAGTHDLKLYLMCDSYMGCDQEYSFQLRVKAAQEGGEEEMKDEE